MNNRHVGGGGGRGDGGTIRAWRIYAQSQRQRTTTLEDRESRSRQTNSASPPGCIPFSLFLSPCLPLPARYPNRSPHLFAVPRTWVYFALAFLFLFFACFALLCSPALFALASSGFIVGYSPDSPRSVTILCADCTLTPARGARQSPTASQVQFIHTVVCVCECGVLSQG